MSELVDRNHEAYDQNTRTIISAISRAFLNGDKDATRERWFIEAEAVAKSRGEKVEPDGRESILWVALYVNTQSKQIHDHI